MFRHNSFLLKKETVDEFEVLLIALLSVVPLINVSNTGIERAALSATLVVLTLIFCRNIQVLGKRMRFIFFLLECCFNRYNCMPSRRFWKCSYGDEPYFGGDDI